MGEHAGASATSASWAVVTEGEAPSYLIELAEAMAQLAIKYKLGSVTVGEIQVVTTPAALMPAPPPAPKPAQAKDPGVNLRDASPVLDPDLFKAGG